MRVSFTWFSAVALGLAFFLPSTAQAQLFRRGCQNCQSAPCESCQPGSSTGDTPAPSEMNPELAEALANNEQSNMDFGAASGPSSSVPGMLGDSYITGAAISYSLGGQTFRSLVPYGGRYKCADNTGPIPTNRVSMSYKHFNGALQAQTIDNTAGTTSRSSGNIDSYTLGVEKVIYKDVASLEVRIPFYAGSVFSDSTAGGAGSDLTSTNFGNLSFILKGLFARNETSALGGGLGVDFPTANTTSGNALGLQQVFYHSREVYLAPFLAFLTVPSDDYWVQGVVQFSFVAGSNSFSSPANQTNAGALGDINGRYREQEMVFVTLNGGKWLYRNSASSVLPGVAAIAELNWTSTMTSANNTTINDPSGLQVVVTNFANNQNIINMTLGMHFQLSPMSNLRVSGVAPLRGSNNLDNLNQNRYFDGEVSVQYNRYF